MIPVVLAHGALGIFDELIFVVIALVFVGMMVGAWWMTRKRTPAAPPTPPTAPTQPPTDDSRPDHFPLV